MRILFAMFSNFLWNQKVLQNKKGYFLKANWIRNKWMKTNQDWDEHPKTANRKRTRPRPWGTLPFQQTTGKPAGEAQTGTGLRRQESRWCPRARKRISKRKSRSTPPPPRELAPSLEHRRPDQVTADMKGKCQRRVGTGASLQCVKMLRRGPVGTELIEG